MLKKIFLSLIAIGGVSVAGLWFEGRNAMNIEKDLSIKTSAETLWNYLVDQDLLMKWNPDILKIEFPELRPVAKKGAKSKLFIREGANTTEYESEIVEFLPHQRLIVTLRAKTLGSSPMYVDYQLQSAGSQMKMKYSATWQPKEFKLRVLSPLIGVMAGKNAEATLEKLKQLAEQ